MDTNHEVQAVASTPSTVKYSEYRFQDPTWLAWWLGSLYMLSPSDQIQVALRMLQVIHARESREVLEGFIEYQGPQEAQGPEFDLAQNTRGNEPDSEQVQTAQSQPLWERVARTAWDRYRIPLIGAGLIIALYVWMGVKWLVLTAGR